jgi:hypothetical protein
MDNQRIVKATLITIKVSFNCLNFQPKNMRQIHAWRQRSMRALFLLFHNIGGSGRE